MLVFTILLYIILSRIASHHTCLPLIRMYCVYVHVCVCVCVCMCMCVCVYVQCKNTTNIQQTKQQKGFTALHSAVCYGKLRVVKHLIQNCPHITMNTHNLKGTSPISDAQKFGYTNITEYLKVQMLMKMVMGVELDGIFPFDKLVRRIIVTYLQ